MRKSKPKKRLLLPDPKYKETLVTRFVNYLMYDGKKSVAYNIFYDACDLVEKRTKENGLETTEVRPDRKISLGIKWMILYSRKRGEKTMMERLAGEIIAAAKGEGAAVKKKDDTHRMAEANKAFSHFRF
jgi:small subunit ribosomal protein S7